MLILGLESSCDETAAALVEDGSRVVSSVISSQVSIHAPYGGVVPELASRNHLDNILPVIQETLDKGNKRLSDIDGIAVTRGPGLVGALLVALSVAKSMAMVLEIPFIGVDHLKAHIAACFLGENKPELPAVALVVSGGHTTLYKITDIEQPMEHLGTTLDDAAGEAFDKVGKLLGLAYPAGPIIERLASDGKDIIDFPRPLMDGSLNFSFSGLKTAVLNYTKINRIQEPGGEIEDGMTSLADICASFQEAVCDVLASKTKKAIEQTGLKQALLVGGVAANGRIREAIKTKLNKIGAELFVPAPVYCTDNAAMVAAVGYDELKKGHSDEFKVDAVSRMFYAKDGGLSV